MRFVIFTGKEAVHPFKRENGEPRRFKKVVIAGWEMNVVMMVLRELSGQVFVGDFAGKYAEIDGKDGGDDGGEVVVWVLVMILRYPINDGVSDFGSKDVHMSFALDEEW